MPANTTPQRSVEQIIRQGRASKKAAAEVAAILRRRKTTELMDDYRETKRIGSVDASEARRWITAELIERIGRPAVVTFEQRAANEANEQTIEARDAHQGDIYVTRENRLYTRRKITRVQHRRSGALVEIALSDHTTRTLDAERSIVVERPESEFATPARSEAQEDCLDHLSDDHGPLEAWNTIARGDVVCEFEDGSIIHVGIDGRYFITDRAALRSHTEAQGVAIAALAKRKGPLLAYRRQINGEAIVQLQDGSIFRMAEDGRCVPAPRSVLNDEATR